MSSPEAFHRRGQWEEGTSGTGIPDRTSFDPGGALFLGVAGKYFLQLRGSCFAVPGALAAWFLNVMAAFSFLGVTVQLQPREAAGHGGLGAAEVHRLCHQRDPQAEPACSWRISDCAQDP